MTFSISPDTAGSLTPQLEGAPRSQSHMTRTASLATPLLPSVSSPEKGDARESSENQKL